ncbi:sensor histidine kinase [Rhodococcus sp. BH5]|uniref:sensor histidine kinase n=1 Tax=Rhodococcus sp. BH5 TaxID=2871702 RepID=UPI0022CD336D|nr:HAMP domain-containing sensor histidine kinase [Rhodococcus sp. BH5]MCZ9635129.1 HAMP domain-containing histidine kinase [Rhodococcus sp. BH5]
MMMIESLSADGRRQGSPLSARWKITAWIMLTTFVLLVVVAITARNLLMRDVEIRANSNVTQEAAEFRTFASEGVDPTTARPFESVQRLFEVYLARQSPGIDEVMLGVIADQIVESSSASARDTLIDERALLEAVSTGDRPSDVLETPTGEIRWGQVQVDNLAGEGGTFVVAVATRPGRDLVDETMKTLSVVGLGGLMLTTVIAYFVAGRILAPVRHVRKVAAETGELDLTARVPVHGRDDIAELAETFNAMLDRIETAYTIQRQFVDDAGHELRTPITVVRGHLELMSDEPEERRKTLDLVDSELSRMGRIVSDLLMLAKAQRPDFVVPEPVDAAQLLLDIESKMQTLGNRVWLLMEVAEGACVLDAERITQAMLQYAANAVSHTSEESQIRLGSKFIGNGDQRILSIWISDEGPGVRSEDVPLIFERFQCGPAAHRTASSQRSGAGLGLAIVRAIADAHHGSAWIRSVHGEGATFGLNIPTPVPDTPDLPQRALTTKEMV